jgi:GTP pyrophosphokinase
MNAIDIDIQKEQQTLVKMYRALLRKARPILKEGDEKIIKKAFNFAVQAHKDMRRRSGEPYIYHPIAVAMIVVEEMGMGTTSIVSALLHDVVEDTEYTIKDIEKEFGPKVARIVDGLTKIRTNVATTGSDQAENFKKMILTIAEDVRVILIKIADRLHNMRTLDSMPKEKQLKISSETEYVYAPLAHRLGMYNIKSELEDLYLKYANEQAFNDISRKLKNSEAARNRFIRMFIRPIEEGLKKNNYTFQIKSRTKSIRSIYNKMKSQSIPFEEVYDLFAIRIIIDLPPTASREEEKSVCWNSYSIVTDYYTPNTERLRDWVSLPKTTGYESLHATVMSKSGQWVEVQIRTSRMDEIAEKGLAAHWKYKSKGTSNAEQGIELWLNKVRESLEKRDIEAIEFMDDFRANLFKDEIFVFTPKGDTKILASGATVLDYAFDVHTKVGAHCLGAKVNNKLVPLNHRLQNGDQIEIITSNKPKANEGWLRFVVTSKARSKIKEYLNEDRKQIALAGKEIIKRKLAHLKMPFEEKTIRLMVEFFGQKNEFELYFSVGKEIIPHTEIKKFKDKIEEPKPAKVEEIAKVEHSNNKKPKNEELIIGGVKDIAGLQYSLAKCCNPIPGDDIFGFTTSMNGIKIHRTTCPNASQMMSQYGHRILKAKWAGCNSTQEYEATLHIEGTDRMGIGKEIMTVVSDQVKVNMVDIHFTVKDGIYIGNIVLSVHNRQEVDDIIATLKNIKDIIKVERNEEVIR